ncbi:MULTISPECIES: TetR/AcrR family transcriptional regulator [Microbacterium]|uniref:TetR/AcrR family transcriptional regulator n=1 Tax=Microbacterium wangchenii TaxID=2541726 RepID=A0ABX5SVG7_9MICO|nr:MULTISPECIES: TetR/AcrR family transcriptional regulator [Microbacterium]MCK6067245.1 TetR/AcrR family transcriptional regulator [Microbacterium sp. EYE_512]QBR89807.1 TetR/AcrR family transcriptional regulator [Microbacterium wangchenii]TXK16595.1 TetR/AcrR family transcriptional regulator [Microbacterium wangchenii]
MKTRTYRMSARADAAESTAERIVDAMLARLRTTPYERVRLEDVASDAGVTVQTVIRRFGSKPGLMTTTVERELARIAATREAAARSTPTETIRALVAHYEEYGLLILKTYAEAPLVPGLADIAGRGRAYHVDWCRRTFAPHLDPELDEATRARRSAQIVALCDATTWRVLRIDGDLDPGATERALTEMLLPLLHRTGPSPS